ncbi:MAG: ribonuclease J [Candidatus Woesebacteria bacterium]|jgi:ribonuclease J
MNNNIKNNKGQQRPQQGTPQPARDQNSVLAKTQTRRGEVQRATRRNTELVTQVASQHIIDVPVNKSVYNGLDGKQYVAGSRDRRPVRGAQPAALRIVPLGGLGEMGIGKNMMAIEYDNDVIIVDMGLIFPGSDYPGINYIIPDITYLEERKHKIRGHIFTHAHLDHIGAFKHLIHRIPAPVYGAPFTIGMLQKAMDEATSGYQPQYNTLNPDAHERVQMGDSFSIELVRVNHSVPDSAAIIIRTPVGTIIHTGDWRFEERPVDGKKFDIERFEQVAKEEGILLLMSESTNVENQGTHAHGEFEVAESIGTIMDKHIRSRLIISTFSSQIHRIQMILDQAQKHGRKVAFAGFSMLQNIEVALRANSIKIPKDTIMRMEDLVKMPDSKVTIVCTGSQGEFNAVLNRMASGAHKHIKVKHTDVIVFSSNPIPGNEKYVVRTVDNLMREGSDVVQNSKAHLDNVGPLHLSGHAYYDDHVRLVNTVKPRFYMPIHGEFHMLVHNAELGEKECGIHKDDIFVLDAGDVLELSHDGTAKRAGRIPVGGIMYDDSGVEVSEIVLKDRIHMSAEGMFVVVLTVSKKTGRLLTSPDIISRGFIYLRDNEEMMSVIRQYLKQKIARAYHGQKVDLDDLKRELKDDLTHILYDQTRRTPIVIPVVNEISTTMPGGAEQQKRMQQG